MSSGAPDPDRLGRELALRHGGDPATVDEAMTLLQVAESPRAQDWTLRSALVRFAQAQPELSGAILESVRRAQRAIDPLGRQLMGRAVMTDRRLSLDADGGLADPAEPVADIRTADLARLARAIGQGHDESRIISRLCAAYDSAVSEFGVADSGVPQPLDSAERQAIPLLMVMLELDDLAEVLVAWAPHAPDDPPIEAANRLGRAAFERLAVLGVEREQRQRPPQRSTRSG